MATFQVSDRVTGKNHEGLDGVVEAITDDGCLVVRTPLGELIEGAADYWVVG